MQWLRGWAIVLLAASAAALLPAAPAQAARTLAASNSVVFTHDRWHPERTVIGSATVLTRAPGASTLTLSFTVTPAGKTARVEAVLTNTGTGTARFTRRGASVAVSVVRNGRFDGVWTLRASRLRSLAPGATRLLAADVALPKPGTYTVTAAARY